MTVARAKLAMNIFSIPAQSAKYKRVFSQLKRLITDDRNRLRAAIVEAVQCQKNWLDDGVVHSHPLSQLQ